MVPHPLPRKKNVQSLTKTGCNFYKALKLTITCVKVSSSCDETKNPCGVALFISPISRLGRGSSACSAQFTSRTTGHMSAHA